jgi:hypothetical protein
MFSTIVGASLPSVPVRASAIAGARLPIAPVRSWGIAGVRVPIVPVCACWSPRCDPHVRI